MRCHRDTDARTPSRLAWRQPLSERGRIRFHSHSAGGARNRAREGLRWKTWRLRPDPTLGRHRSPDSRSDPWARPGSGFVFCADVLSGGGAQAVDFFQGEDAELSRRHIERERSILHALDFFHVMADLLKHAPDLPVADIDTGDL